MCRKTHQIFRVELDYLESLGDADLNYKKVKFLNEWFMQVAQPADSAMFKIKNILKNVDEKHAGDIIQILNDIQNGDLEEMKEYIARLHEPKNSTVFLLEKWDSTDEWEDIDKEEYENMGYELIEYKECD